MNFVTILFYFFEVVAALAALSLVLVRNVFYGALILVVCLLSLAAIYVLAFAEFVAVTQILIYAGGILVVIIFGVMLTAKIAGKPLVVKHTNLWSGTLACIALFTLLLYFLSSQKFFEDGNDKVPATDTAINTIGFGLMTEFVLPFEVAGILLLAALIGAAVIASSIKSRKV
jgi:NADH-quinone oxidoreductase subunit J